MTINKSQGQSFDKVGIYLNRPCFAHGQLYVAFPRARSHKDVSVNMDETPEQGREKGHWYEKRRTSSSPSFLNIHIRFPIHLSFVYNVNISKDDSQKSS